MNRWKTDKKTTLYETVQSILGKEAVISGLVPMCPLKIRNMDYLTNTGDVEEAIKANVELHLSTAEDKN